MSTPLRRRRAAVALFVVCALVASACSGSGGDQASDEVRARDGGVVPGDAMDPAGGSDAEPVDRDGDGIADAPLESGGGAGPAGSGGAASSGGGAGAGGPGRAGSGGGSGGGPGGGSGGGAIRDANLFSGAANTEGITDDRIVLCGHAALIFADAFDVRPEDLNVYWEAVNQAGGVHGRRVEVSWEDDAYNSGQAVQAAERCRAKRPFFLLGGIGFDQIPAVRQWAEDNKMLYLHHMAVEAGMDRLRYSFSGLPSVERTGRAFGEHLVARHRDRTIGIIWRDSENWKPGSDAGRKVLRDHGVTIAVDQGVTVNQAVYTQQILALQRANVDVVWLWENALTAAEVIQQAKAQGYNPRWVVFPFQTTLDIVGHVDIEGVAGWSAYAPGGYEGNPFAEFGYGEEIRRFEETMARYRPRTRTNDILWQVWVANKGIHDMLNRCGRDCTRNRLAGVLESGLRTRVDPACLVDFSRPDSYGGRLGGFQFYVLEGVRHRSGPAFATSRWCTERFL